MARRPAAEELTGDPCAQLTAVHDEAPTVQLVSPGPESSGADVRRRRQGCLVDVGRGAYVLSGSWRDTDQGSPFVIDSKGRANPLVGDDTADPPRLRRYPGGRGARLLDQAVRLRGQSLPRRRALAAGSRLERVRVRLRAAAAASLALTALGAGTVVGTSAPSYAVDNSCEGVRRRHTTIRDRPRQRAARPARHRARPAGRRPVRRAARRAGRGRGPRLRASPRRPRGSR